VNDITRADVCIVACAEAFRGDGEILASPMGPIPAAGVRLAKATFEPGLAMTDGVAAMVEGPLVTGRMPYRKVFDVVWSGKRHVMMGAAQIDGYGNQNISCIGDHARPTVQLLGARGAPGNTICHPTSYWVPAHSARIFVPKVDFVSGVGYDRAAELGVAARFHEIRRVVTNLCVLDFKTTDNRMRLASVHPGVTVEDVVKMTGFELFIGADVPTTRLPTSTELNLIRDVIDPSGQARSTVSA
jgi:acyl CoA:acetate/3-ketoacid CoA transferase beta subunit